MTKAMRLLALAQDIADATPDFFTVKGPGAGNLATNAFVEELRHRAQTEFDRDYSEKLVCGSNGFRVDYYIPDEETVVEVALGLPKPKTEFERDVLKVIMAIEAGNPVRRLLFISKPGGVKKCSQPGRSEIMRWLDAKYGVVTEIHDLEAAPA